MSYITTDLTTGKMESLEAYRKLEKKIQKESFEDKLRQKNLEKEKGKGI